MDIPSLFMIPSAVSSGKVHSVFPNSTDADFDFNRDSDATRVNSEGLIERVGYYGSEEITNGSFDTDTNWVKGTGWSIANGKASNDGSQSGTSEIYQTGVVVIGKTYKLVYDIVNYTSGTVRIRCGNTFDVTNNAIGTYTAFLTATSNGGVGIQASADFIGSIDNVSVKEVTGDRARLNYEIEGGLVNTKPSLLLEPQSTNLIANSNFQSGWSILSGGTIVTNKVTSPDGSKNAAILIGDGINSNAPYISMSVTSGTSYAFSVFVKPILATSFRLIGFSAQAGGSAKFDLSSGTVSFAANDDLSDAKIEDYGNGWFRCSVIATADGTGSALFGFESEFDINGDNFYIYGAQFEQQSYPTSLIPTNGSTQTRAAETCNGAGTSSILPSEEGILYAEIAALADDGTFRMLSVSDGTNDNRVRINYSSTSEQLQVRLVTGGVTQADLAKYSTGVTSFHKTAIRYKANEVKLYVDGSQVGNTDTSASVPSAGTLNVINFDGGNGANIFYGKIRDIRVYNTKEMTDSEVDILLTKITS
jgi:hypothetical protein